MPYANVNSVELFYEDHGSGQPLILLHGWGTCGSVWDAQREEFARDHRVITPDWRGCGRSGRPESNTIADNAEDILALAGALKLDAPVLVGCSAGAAIVLEAACRAPSFVRAVVAVDGPGYWPAERKAEQLSLLRQALSSDRAETVKQWVVDWYGPLADPSLLEWTTRQILESSASIDQILTDAVRHNPRATIGELAVPAVFIHGELDAEIPMEVSETLAELAPHGEAHIMQESGHMPHVEQPAEFNALLRSVLRRFESPDAPRPSATE
ncbi:MULTISPECIES: alpha/beta hydrolase [unclassified Streptomyces]|uniref:alpha/beta fold hydrolase n=1 Tax=unclassified Streptomyces TaxID=2593676 RepID=UPI002DD7DE36|nr:MULTISPECIES: alpha/beta hydrolase [unclassified Streptomyces]WSA91355.1 alpha/beta hydrolase [Streptomyces sp. NBC_01795]WSB75679.1 alpha/beta hydrolase [Streptomyces sp. NBC_01775]WSS16036.1 alpha/beta hydrolase [Streptomyces sp. NBC_01186]WSS44856.1 alpha/beta hydrolase [Streptomyces sp. NBC_01187]